MTVNTNHKNKTILVSTYAVNPYRGSEDSIGWNYICQIARFHKIIAITRKNNRASIEKYMYECPNEIYKNIQFLYFDLPYWQRFWKRGNGGALLYYWIWQKRIISFIKKQAIQFDIVQNINFINDWIPSYLWKLNKPFIWGPIGHHPLIPSQYLKPYKKTYAIIDKLKWTIKQLFWKYSSALKETVKNADFIYCINNSVLDVIEVQQNKYAVYPSVASEDFGYDSLQRKKKFRIISVGRLVPLKGFDLSILAFAKFLDKVSILEKDNIELVIVGSGKELKFYKDLVEKNNIEDYVHFIEWMDRMELMNYFKEATLFLFPSHEGAGMVVSEALSFGLPVVCLDNCGPGSLIDSTCGIAIPIQGYQNTVDALGAALSKVYNNPGLRLQMSKNARLKFEQKFHWDRRGEFLNTVYLNLDMRQ